MNLKSLLIPLIFLYPLTAIPQVAEWLATNFDGSQALNIELINDDTYLVVNSGIANEIIPGVEYKTVFYRIDLDDDSLNFELNEMHTIYNEPDSVYYTITADYIQESQEWLLAQSYDSIPGSKRIRFLLFDDKFNLLKRQYLNTKGYINVRFFTSSANEHTYLLGTILGPPKDQIVFMDYDHISGILHSPKVGQTVPNHSTWITSMLLDPSNMNMVVYYYNGIQVIDTNYYQVQNYLWLDTLGDRSHDNYPFAFSSMDERDGEFLVGGHLDGPFSHFYIFDSYKKFYLAKYDTSLNRLWYNEYGGDRAYWMYGLKILPDESCMAYGFVTDTTTGYRHAYVLHVGQHGEILTSTEFPVSLDDGIKVFGDHSGNVVITNQNNLQLTFNLFDEKGILLKNLNIGERYNDVEMTNFPGACYFYNLVLKGNVVKAGKLVKM